MGLILIDTSQSKWSFRLPGLGTEVLTEIYHLKSTEKAVGAFLLKGGVLHLDSVQWPHFYNQSIEMTDYLLDKSLSP